MAEEKGREEFEIVDALAEGTDGGPVEITDSGLTLNLGGEEDYEEAAPEQASPEELAELAQVTAELNARAPETIIEPSLERIEMLMDLLGHPERSFHVIQVAGTNGKSSTARMIDSLLRSFHRRVGLVTSPHLQLVTERIGIDGHPIHPRDFVRIWREIQPYVEMVDSRSEIPMSTFEALVGISYAAFADAPIDVAVVEVGLGGTWDATNVVNAEVAVVMPVGMDHTDYLGDTITEIASEKAGIIKAREHDVDDVLTPGENIAIIAEQDPEAMRVILQRTVDVGAGVARAGSEFAALESRIAVGGQQLTIQGLGGLYEDIFLPLHGEHQGKNAAVALAAVEAFFGASSGNPIDIASVRTGFAKAISPGRLERVRTSPTTFLDACHNPHGAKALAAALDRDFDFARLIGVVSIFTDKDATGILTALESVLTDVIITQNSSPRARDAYELAEIARDIFGEERVFVDPDLPGAYTQAVELAEDADVQSGSGIIITGSVVTAGDARALFGKEPA